MLFTLDLATQTGWCAGSGETTPELGTILMPDTKDEVGPFLSFFRGWLDRKLGEVQPSMVIFEAPVLPRAKVGPSGHLIQAPTTMATTRKLQGLAGVAEMVCYDRGIDCREVFNQTVKAALGGHGGKPDMVAAAKRCGLNPRNFDEADAFGVWIVGVRHYAKVFAPLWDQRLFGQRKEGGGGLL